MRLGRTIISTVVALSLIANGWLGYKLYESNRILNMQSAEYRSFLSYLQAAVTASDKELSAKSGSQIQSSDATALNVAIAQSAGFIMGMRVDLAKKGMDVFPVYLALMQAESYPGDSLIHEGKAGENQIKKGNQTLHGLYATLGNTSFTRAGLPTLRQAVQSLDEKYPGYPSYGRLN